MRFCKNFLFLISFLIGMQVHAGEEDAATLEKGVVAPRFSEGRTPEIKQRISGAFASLEMDKISCWGVYNGTSQSYVPGGVLEASLLCDMIRTHKERTTFWAMDVGAGNFGWLKGMLRGGYKSDPNLTKLLSSQEMAARAPMTVHLVGVRGEKQLEEECTEVAVGPHKVVLHQYGGVEVENIVDALTKKGLDMSKVEFDLIVTFFSLTHLVDPFGTVTELHGVTRKGGFFFFDSFGFQVNNESAEKANNDSPASWSKRIWKAVTHLDARSAFVNVSGGARRWGQFAIQKSGPAGPIPLAYGPLLQVYDENSHAGHTGAQVCFKTRDGAPLPVKEGTAELPKNFQNLPMGLVVGHAALVTALEPHLDKLSSRGYAHSKGTALPDVIFGAEEAPEGVVKPPMVSDSKAAAGV